MIFLLALNEKQERQIRPYIDTGDLLCELTRDRVVADLLSHHGVTVFSALPRELERFRSQFNEREGQEPGFSSEVTRALGLPDPEIKTQLTPVQVFRRLLIEDCLAKKTLHTMGVNVDQLLEEAQGVTHTVLEKLQTHLNGGGPNYPEMGTTLRARLDR